jgi:signal peptidase I
MPDEPADGAVIPPSESPDGQGTGGLGVGSAAPDDGKRRIPFWVEFPILIIVALGVAILIKTFLFQAFYIPSSSMEDTLNINDRVLVNKITYRVGDIAHGDVIVFDDPRGGFEESPESVVDSALRNVFESIGLATPRSEFIKRVIGLPGDTVEGKDGHVYVNGKRLVEPYLKEPAYFIPPFGPVSVPHGQLFVMGDNRAASQDSRYFGTIPIDDVVGKAFVIIWPPAHWGGL